MTGNGTDAYGGFPVVSPGSGNYSLKLGNSNTGAEAERARYYIKVPPGSGKQLLIYRLLSYSKIQIMILPTNQGLK